MAPLPASEQRLCHYAAYLAQENLAHSSIKCYLSAVRHLHVADNLADPKLADMAKLEQVMKGIKRSQAGKGKQAVKRRPMSTEVLTKLKEAWQSAPGGQDSRMLWAAATLCFFGFLRSGEMTVPSEQGYDAGSHLSVGDISTDSLDTPTVLKVRLKASKTDQFRKGCDVFVGRTGSQVCPVTAVLAFMVDRGLRPGPLFLYQDGRPLTRPRFVAEVKCALARAGMDSRGYSGHSFRIGAATTASERGIGEAVIKRLGRWGSAAYQGYIQTPRVHLAGVSKLMAGAGAEPTAKPGGKDSQ